MFKFIFGGAMSCLLIMAAVPASASSSGLISKRSGYTVSAEMMHAIDVIVAEHSRMMRHKRMAH